MCVGWFFFSFCTIEVIINKNNDNLWIKIMFRDSFGLSEPRIRKYWNAKSREREVNTKLSIDSNTEREKYVTNIMDSILA